MHNQKTRNFTMCFAHTHLSPAEYGLYSFLRGISKNLQFNYRFDDRDISDRFAPTRGGSKDAINRLRRSLAEKGWIEWLEPKKRNSHGRYSARLGHILSHDEYRRKYPERCTAGLANETGSSIENATGPVSNSRPDLYRQRDVKGNTFQKEIKTNGNASDSASPGSSPSLTQDSRTGASATDFVSPVSTVIQDVSNTAPQQAAALCERFTPATELTELPASVQKLAELMKAHIGVAQNLDNLSNIERLANVSPQDVETLFKWTISNDPEGFWWGAKFTSSSSLRLFCKSAPTIVKQFNNQSKLKKLKSSAKSKTTTYKAASVAPDPAKPFQYAGEII